MTGSSERLVWLARWRSTLFALTLLTVLVLMPHPASADSTGIWEWGIAAGGREEFFWPPGNHVVGTHTMATLENMTIDSNLPSHTYGFGVGHITTAGAHNWATIENTSGTTGSSPHTRSTQFTKVCSISGHLLLKGIPYGGGPNPTPATFSARKQWTNTGGIYRVRETGTDSFGIGLGMAHQWACLYHQCSPPPERLRWECIYSTNDTAPGTPLTADDFNTSISTFRYDVDDRLYGVFLDATEHVETAEHGLFSRVQFPPAIDTANVTFRDNRYYFYNALNHPDNCVGDCSSRTSNAEDWIAEGSDNHLAWEWPGWFEYPSANLRVYDNSTRQWRACLNKGGPCGADPNCDQTILPWANPRCQEGDWWCWAAAVQSIVYNITGDEPDQCEIVSKGWGFPSGFCPEKSPGWPHAVTGALDAYGIATLPLLVHPPSFPSQRPTFEEIRAEIDAGKPLLAGIQWSSGWDDLHAVLILGYECDPAGHDVLWLANIVGCGEDGAITHTPITSEEYSAFTQNTSYKWIATQKIQ